MRINVISLGRTPGRLCVFRERNAHLRDVVVFEGIDGLTVSQNDLAARDIIVPPIHYAKVRWAHALAHGSVGARSQYERDCENLRRRRDLQPRIRPPRH